MDPDEFLSRDEFEALSEDDQASYAMRFSALFEIEFGRGDAERRLAYAAPLEAVRLGRDGVPVRLAAP